jgi:hypothetical protein
MSGNRGTEQNVKITYDDYSLRETSLLKTEEKIFFSLFIENDAEKITDRQIWILDAAVDPFLHILEDKGLDFDNLEDDEKKEWARSYFVQALYKTVINIQNVSILNEILEIFINRCCEYLDEHRGPLRIRTNVKKYYTLMKTEREQLEKYFDDGISSGLKEHPEMQISMAIDRKDELSGYYLLSVEQKETMKKYINETLEELQNIYKAFIKGVLTRNEAERHIKAEYNNWHKKALGYLDKVCDNHSGYWYNWYADSYIKNPLDKLLALLLNREHRDLPFLRVEREKALSQNTDTVDKKEAVIPEVIRELERVGFIEQTSNGKFILIGGKSDKKIIEWVFDYSTGYGDELTADIYKKYIVTTNSPATIDRYISEYRNLDKKKKK